MHRRTLITVILSVVMSLVFTLTTLAADKQKPRQKLMDNYIAVFDVETVDVDKKLSRPLTESIRRELVMSGKYEIIDRGNMNKILSEQKFQMSGCVAGQCVVEAGQLLGAGKIISGSVSLVGKTYYLTLSLISVETGKIENVSEDKCKCEVDELLDSSKRLVKKLLGESVPEQPSVTTSSTTPSTPFSKGEYKDPTTGMECIFVKGGCFEMGDTLDDGTSDEKPVHEVCVDDFYIGKFEVTQGQWAAVMENNPSYFKDCGDNCPVEQVSWNDAQEFIRKLNSRSVGNKYRLPTEAEWEYAARSGGKREIYSGGENIDSVAWYSGNAGGRTHPVGSKSPNSFGIYDMSGNVWEWCQDWYDGSYYRTSQRTNPTGPRSGFYRVLRGGNWDSDPGYVRASRRNDFAPVYRGSAVGLRLLRTP